MADQSQMTYGGFVGLMVKFFVTGGAGFIGKHFVDSATDRQHEVCVYDRVSDRFDECSSRHLTDSVVEFGPDWIVHLAATPGVSNGARVAVHDILCAERIIEAATEVGAKILFPSTGSVYGRQWQFPTIESAMMRPQEGFYATGKLAVEGLLSSWCGQARGRTAVVLRLGTILGPGNNKGFTRDFVQRLTDDPSRLTTWGDGKQVKSYLHIDDMVSAMWHVMGCSPGFEIFNVANDRWASIRDCIPWVCDEMGVSPEIVFGTEEMGTFGDIPAIKLSNAKLRSAGWAPSKSIEQAVRDNVRWLLDQRKEKAA